MSEQHELDLTEQPLVETGIHSVYDETLSRYGKQGVLDLEKKNEELTAAKITARITARRLVAVAAAIDVEPGAFTNLDVRAAAMQRFVVGAAEINRARGAGSAYDDLQERYDNPAAVLKGMDKKAASAEHVVDISRRILTGEAALIAAGFSEDYAMAVRVAIRKDLEPLKATGSDARKARKDAIEKTARSHF